MPDAAGAVRRTPRPEPAFLELWWSPTIGVWRRTPRGPRLTPGFEMVNDPIGGNFREALPADAVQLAAVPAVARGERAGAIKGGTVIDWVKQMVAEYTDEVGHQPPPDIVAHITVAVLREMGWERQDQDELEQLQDRLDDAIKLIEEMAGHLRQDAALNIGVETRLAALQDEQQDDRTASSGPTAQGIPTDSDSTVDVAEVRRTWAPGMDPFAVAVEQVPRAALHLDAPAEPTGEADRG